MVETKNEEAICTTPNNFLNLLVFPFPYIFFSGEKIVAED